MRPLTPTLESLVAERERLTSALMRELNEGLYETLCNAPRAHGPFAVDLQDMANDQGQRHQHHFTLLKDAEYGRIEIA